MLVHLNKNIYTFPVIQAHGEDFPAVLDEYLDDLEKVDLNNRFFRSNYNLGNLFEIEVNRNYIIYKRPIHD